jgi:hypothetical protein
MPIQALVDELNSANLDELDDVFQSHTTISFKEYLKTLPWTDSLCLASRLTGDRLGQLWGHDPVSTSAFADYLKEDVEFTICETIFRTYMGSKTFQSLIDVAVILEAFNYAEIDTEERTIVMSYLPAELIQTQQDVDLILAALPEEDTVNRTHIEMLRKNFVDVEDIKHQGAKTTMQENSLQIGAPGVSNWQEADRTAAATTTPSNQG